MEKRTTLSNRLHSQQSHEVNDSKCFICSESQASPRFFQSLFLDNLIPNLIKEKRKILRIFCRILYVKWEGIEGILSNTRNGELPFCEKCSENVMRLVSLREKIFFIQSQMSDGIKYIRETIAKEIEADSSLENDSKIRNTSFREHFRSEVYEEYVNRELLVTKIEEHNSKSKILEHVVEVEPSLFQPNLGIFSTSPPEEASTQNSSNVQNQKPKTGNISTNNTSPISKPSTLKPASSYRDSFEKSTTRSTYSLRNSEKNKEKINEIEIKKEPIENESNFEEDDFTYESLINEEESIENNNEEAHNLNDDDDESYTNEISDSKSVDSDFKPRRTRSGRIVKSKTNLRSSSNNKSKDSLDDEKEDLSIGGETDNEKNSTKKRSESRKWDIPFEKLNEIIEDEAGKLFYDGIEIIRTHLPKREFILTCSQCDEKIDSRGQSYKRGCYRNMKIHMKRYHLDSYKCKICGKNLSDHRVYHKHMIRRHGPNKKGRKFIVPEDVELGSDGKLYYNDTEIVKTTLKEGTEEDDEEYELTCTLCSKIYSSLSKKNDRQTPMRRLIYHIRGTHMRVFKCKECSKSYTGSKSLKSHILTKHTEGRVREVFHCDICQKPLKLKKHIKSHMWSHYNAEERAAALASGQKEPFSYSKYMRQRKEQGKDKNFMCTECGKTFHMLCNLKRHEPVHWQEKKNHQCPYCGKFYCTLSSMTNHVKYVHETDRVHTKYFCDFCDKRFTSKTDYVKHRRTHTKELPYSCSKCGKPFALRRSLVRHSPICDSIPYSKSRVRLRDRKKSSNGPNVAKIGPKPPVMPEEVMVDMKSVIGTQNETRGLSPNGPEDVELGIGANSVNEENRTQVEGGDGGQIDNSYPQGFGDGSYGYDGFV